MTTYTVINKDWIIDGLIHMTIIDTLHNGLMIIINVGTDNNIMSSEDN